MQVTYYSAFDVLKKYLEQNHYVISNFNLMFQRPDNVLIWVDNQNPKKATHFVCEKNSPTQFLIWGYIEDGTEIVHTSLSYARPSNV